MYLYNYLRHVHLFICHTILGCKRNHMEIRTDVKKMYFRGSSIVSQTVTYDSFHVIFFCDDELSYMSLESNKITFHNPM